MSIIKLRSKDGKMFEVDVKTAMKSITIKNMLENVREDAGNDDEVPLTNVEGKILQKVLEWCEHHKADPPITEDESAEKRTDDISDWDKEYIKVDDQETLFNIILAANFLDIKGLLDLGCKNIAELCKNKTPDDIRKTFNVANKSAAGDKSVAGDDKKMDAETS